MRDYEQKYLNQSKKIHDLEGKLSEKDLLINKQQKKIARLNAVNTSLSNFFSNN